MSRPNRIDVRPFLKLAFALAIWWILPPVVRSAFKDVFYEMQAPAQIAQSHFGDLQNYWGQRVLVSKERLMAVVRDLARTNRSLIFDNERLRAVEKENENLRLMLDLKPRAEYRMLVARVVRRDLNAWWRRLTIRRGSVDGIEPGFPVVAGENVVGRVLKVHRHTCEVQLVSDPAFRVSVHIDGLENRAAVYQGIVNRPFDAPRGIIHNIPENYKLPRPTDEAAPNSADEAAPNVTVAVFTSGSGGVFPPLLRIGTFSSKGLSESENGLFKMADVELLPELSSLEEVSILVPLNNSVPKLP